MRMRTVPVPPSYTAGRDSAIMRLIKTLLRNVTWCTAAGSFLPMQDPSRDANASLVSSPAHYIKQAVLVQGIRRVIAVTASEAEEAINKAEGLTKAMGAAEKLHGAQLDAELAGLRQVRAMLWQSSLWHYRISQSDIATHW